MADIQDNGETQAPEPDTVERIEKGFYEFIAEFWEFIGTGIFQVKGTPVTVGSILVFALMVLFFVFLSKIISYLLYHRLLSRVKMDEGIRFTLQRITHYTILVVGILFSFQFIGIDLTGLTVIFGLLSVGIGFGLQNLTSNFISGIILLFERPISIGDRIMVGDLEGDVKEINIRSTTINSLDNISIIVPNSDFVSNRVINYSHGDTRIRILVDVGVSYASDLDLVLDTIKASAQSHPEVLEIPEPDVLLKNFGDSAWEMVLRCWIASPARHPKISSDLRCDIVRKFREKDIVIPFPQRDLHVRSPLPVPLSQTENTDSTQKGD